MGDHIPIEVVLANRCVSVSIDPPFSRTRWNTRGSNWVGFGWRNLAGCSSLSEYALLSTGEKVESLNEWMSILPLLIC